MSQFPRFTSRASRTLVHLLCLLAPGAAIADLGEFQPVGPSFLVYGSNSAQAPEDHDALVEFGFRTSIDLSDLDSTRPCDLSAWWFEYRQRFLFEIDEHSAPIDHTDYMPATYYEQGFCPPSPSSRGLGSWPLKRVAAGWRHRSNGRSAIDSRTWDVAFVTLTFGRDSFDDPSVSITPRLTLNKSNNNRRVDDFLGHVALGFRKAWGSKDEDFTILTVEATKGSSDDNGSYTVALTRPDLLPGWINLAQYGLAAYYRLHDGYGENLINFDRRSTSFRIGIRFDLR